MNNSINKELGNFIKSIRQLKKISAKDLGEKIGYSQSHISGIENGQKALPSIKFLESYLMALKVSTNEYNQYIEEIAKITDGAISLTKIKNFDKSKLADKLNEMALPYEFRFLNYKDDIETNIYNLPINDLYFHLTDIYNRKFYKNIVINEVDRKNIEMLIDNYFLNKSNIQRDIRNNIVHKKFDAKELERNSNFINSKINND